MAKHSEATIGDLLVQMRLTNRLLAAQLRSRMSQQELVGLLAGSGAPVQEVASILDTTPATISTTLQRLKRKVTKGSRRNIEQQ